MSPRSDAEFARLFRGLSGRERTAFVAAVWRARGWETSVDGDGFDAERGGVRRRVAVRSPGVFGAPSLDGVDALVVTRDRPRVRGAAAAADVDYLTPSALHDRLLYGVDRETATRLFEEAFDRPLLVAAGTDSAAGAGPANAGGTTSWLSTALDRASALPTVRRFGAGRLAVVLVLCLLVGAAVAGPGFAPNLPRNGGPGVNGPFTPGEVGAIGGSATEGVTATAGGGASARERPAGLGDDGIEDLPALLDAHAAAVEGRSYVLRVRGDGPPSARPMQGRTAWNYTVRVESDTHYRYDGRFTFPHYIPEENVSGPWTMRTGVYADGETKFRRLVGPRGTRYRQYPIAATGDATGYVVGIRQALATYLLAERSFVSCARLDDAGECIAYRVQLTGEPTNLPEDVEDYRAVAVVEESGLVSSLSVSYTVATEDGGREQVSYGFTYSGVGDTSVSPPPWLDAAKSATDGEEDPSATPPATEGTATGEGTENRTTEGFEDRTTDGDTENGTATRTATGTEA